MSLGHKFRRQHAAAAHRRAPAPQLGFDPDAFFSRTRDQGRHTELFPTLTPIDIIPTSTTTTSEPVLPTTTPTTPSTTSTTSTSTSTSTSAIPTTTSSSTPVVVVPTTTSTTPVVTTTLAPKTAIVTTSVPHTSASNTAAAASASSSASSVPETTSGVSTGALVGGIIAGILAVVAIICAIVFFIRRSRKRDSFSEGDFRRSAMVLNDPPTHEDTVARGFNPGPSPPSMVERHASAAPTFGTQYGYPGEYATNNAGFGASMHSFAPGQVINVNVANAVPVHPMYTPQSPYEQYTPQKASYPVLTRQGSNGSSEGDRQAQSPTQMKRESLPANDYVDLSRSSVSPFQAAQYVEISRRLNAEVPEGLRTADIDRDLPPLPPVDERSPFDDPASAPPSPGAQYAIDRRNVAEPMQVQVHARPVSSDSLGTNEQVLDFPVPPSPVMTPTSRYRIDSTPPMLPEINVESRVSVGGYPMLSARDSGAPAVMGLTPGGSRFPMTPSPLASSFGLPSPMPAAAFADAPPTPRTPAAVPPDPKKRETTYSMYDPEDAYGGI